MRKKRLSGTITALAAVVLLACGMRGALAADAAQDPSERLKSLEMKNALERMLSPFTAIDEVTGLSAMKFPIARVTGRIAFSSNRSGSPGIHVFQNGATAELCRNGTEPRWSPDGRTILCRPTADTVRWDMALVNPQGRLDRVLMPFQQASIHQALFCPADPDMIFFKGRKDPYSQEALFTLRLKDNSTQRIVTRTMESFDVSPDGKTIVFTALKDEDNPRGGSCLWLMSDDGTRAWRMSNTDGGRHPAFSPDGRYIAYISRGLKDEFRQIFIAFAEGDARWQATGSAFHKDWPCWSPDGRRLCYEAFVHGSETEYSELFVVNADGTGESRIMNPGKNGSGQWFTDSRPRWAAP